MLDGDLEIGARLLSASARPMLAMRINSLSAREIAPWASQKAEVGDCKPPVVRVTSSQRQSAIRFMLFVRSAVVPGMQSRCGNSFRVCLHELSARTSERQNVCSANIKPTECATREPRQSPDVQSCPPIMRPAAQLLTLTIPRRQQPCPQHPGPQGAIGRKFTVPAPVP
jgi:hypothetical protein